MPKTVKDASLEVFNPGNSGDTSPDDTVSGADLAEVDIRERVQDLLDTGEITIHDNDGSYNDSITAGDRLRFLTQLQGESSLSLRWTGYVGPTRWTEATPSQNELQLTVSDFVFAVLETRRVYNSFTDRAISGSSDAILETILTNNASEIDQSKIKDVNTTATVTWNGKTLLEAIRELAEDANALVAQDDTSLVFRPLGGVPTQWTLQASDRGPLSVRENDDGLVNELRVEGGQDINEDDTQTTQSSTVTVTDSNRLTQQLNTTKSRIPRVDVYTQTTGSGHNVVVRIQEDDGSGNPRDVANRDADVVRRTLASDFLASDGYTTFLMRPHDHHFYNFDPHLIIESDGSTGQDIGTDGSGNPTYKQYYPFPLDTIVEDEGSINEYRRRERPHRDESLEDKGHTEDRGEAILSHAKRPDRTASFEAQSTRAHNLGPGEAIHVDQAKANFQADAILVERAETYDGSRNELTTDLTVQDVNTI